MTVNWLAFAEVAQKAAEQTAQVAEQAQQQAAAAVAPVWPHLPAHWPAQVDLLQWAQSMGALTAAALMLAGMVYLAFGVYAYRALITINAAVFGAYIGALIGDKAGNQLAGAMVGGFVAGAASWPLMKYAVAAMGGVMGLLLGASIWRAAGLDPNYAWSGGATGMVFFGMLSFLLFRGSIMMYTSLQGSVMLVFGLLGLIYKYQDLAPKVNETMLARSFLLPLAILVPATIGLIYQQTQYPAQPAKKT
jgi:hypothetical protein